MKKFTLLFSIVMLGFLNVIWAQDAPSGKAAPQNYFKFQARLKVGLGQTFTALPMKFEDMVIKGIDNSSRSAV
jgi:hypothetical protein